jgi:ankyrin repeat protein
VQLVDLLDFFPDEYEWSPLHIAVRRGVPEIVQLLLKSGANINYSTPASKTTPLTLCCEYVNLEIATILLNELPSNLTQGSRLSRFFYSLY